MSMLNANNVAILNQRPVRILNFAAQFPAPYPHQNIQHTKTPWFQPNRILTHFLRRLR